MVNYMSLPQEITIKSRVVFDTHKGKVYTHVAPKGHGACCGDCSIIDSGKSFAMIDDEVCHV